MLDDLLAVATAQGGYLFRHQLNASGVSDAQIRQACASRLLTRVRHGTYVPHDVWRLAGDVERHAIVARSVLDKLGPTAAASHVTAAVLHGLDVWNVDLGLVHLTRVGGGVGRREAGVVFHENQLKESDVVEVDGRPVTAPTRTVLECACTVGIEEGMVIASSGLRSAVVDVELEPRLEEIGHWPGARHARLALRMSDGRAETVGEVRSLYLMWRFDLPRPDLQQTLVLRDGRSARLDFLWEESRHCGEFDGVVKLGRLNPFGEGDLRALVQEKQREDAVRDRRWGVSRWGWVDLGPARRAATARMILEGLAQSRRLYVPLSAR
jgi:hypothetical protein